MNLLFCWIRVLRKKFLFVTVLQCVAILAASQNTATFALQNSTFVFNGKDAPFWFTSGRNGKVVMSEKFLNVAEAKIYRNPAFEEKVFSSVWGAGVLLGSGMQETYTQFNNAFAGVVFKGWSLTAGAFYDTLFYGGLSSSNGNLARSNNARPYPKVRLSTASYKPVPFLNNKLFYKFEYDEGMLNDRRYVKNTRLHHKSMYLMVKPVESWKISAGFEHYVMWGGISADENTGALPSGFKEYLIYISGSGGTEKFPKMDQNNIAGNQLGTYQLQVEKRFRGNIVSFYLSHLFEDLSGVNWRNWPDNLAGVHFQFSGNNAKGSKRLVTDVVYEYTDTRHQSIRDSLAVWNEITGTWRKQEPDNYFNHGIYKSGFTYHRRIIGSPLFFPVKIDKKGIPEGRNALISNRFFAHHIGVKGNLSGSLHWKGLLTYIHHMGTYRIPFDSARKQFSGLLDLQYQNMQFPLKIGFAMALDYGSFNSLTLGAEFRVAKEFNF